MEQEIMTMKYGDDVLVNVIKEHGKKRVYQAVFPNDVIFESDDLETVLRKIKEYREL